MKNSGTLNEYMKDVSPVGNECPQMMTSIPMAFIQSIQFFLAFVCICVVIVLFYGVMKLKYYEIATKIPKISLATKIIYSYFGCMFYVFR